MVANNKLKEFVTVLEESSQNYCKMLMKVFYVTELEVIGSHFITLVRLPTMFRLCLYTAGNEKGVMKLEGTKGQDK